MSIQINEIINSIINCLNHGCFLFYNYTFIILPNIETSPMLEHSTDDCTFEQFEKQNICEQNNIFFSLNV